MKTQIARSLALLENCGECGGSGYVPCEPDGEPDGCSACKITGKAPIALPSHLMAIVGSLVDASRAFDVDKRCTEKNLAMLDGRLFNEANLIYCIRISQTAERYIAAAMVGLMQIAGEMIQEKVQLDTLERVINRHLSDEEWCNLGETANEQFFQAISVIYHQYVHGIVGIGKMIVAVKALANHHNIDLDRHIDAYLSYKEGER